MDDPLALDREAMRATGYRMVDLLVDRVAGVRDWPALTRASPTEMRERLHGPAPEAGTDFDTLLATLERDVLANMARVDHPAYFAFIPGVEHVARGAGRLPRQRAQRLRGLVDGVLRAEPGRAAGARLVQGLDRLPGGGVGDPAQRRLGGEHDRARRARARRCAGAMRDDLVVYVSDQAHSSLARAARSLGFRPDQVRVLPVDEDHRMRPDAARRGDGRRRRRGPPAAVRRRSARARPTPARSTRWPSWPTICRAPRRVAARRRRLRRLRGADRARARLRCDGIELADSVTLDPHKWLYQPFECGCLLVREGARLRRAFTLTPDYLADAEAEDEEVNFSDLGAPAHALLRGR